MNARLTADQESECAIYAENTDHSAEELKSAFRAHILECKDSGRDPERVQDWLEAYLRANPSTPFYRVLNVGSHETLYSGDSLDEARAAALECESHETQPEVAIQRLDDVTGEWVGVR